MGAIFDPPSPPKIPAPPPPQPMADLQDPAVQAARTRAIQMAAARSGRASTLLSGGDAAGERLGQA
jgi:hypothetical protein